MKKFAALLLALLMVASLVACSNNQPTQSSNPPAQSSEPAKPTGDPSPSQDPVAVSDYKVAMITDYGDITDQSFNQTTYEACQEFCKENEIEFNYFKPAGDTTPDRVAMIEKAIDDGYNIIVMPGYAFGGAIVESAPNYPDVKFFALTWPRATCWRLPLPTPASSMTTMPTTGISPSTST